MSTQQKLLQGVMITLFIIIGCGQCHADSLSMEADYRLYASPNKFASMDSIYLHSQTDTFRFYGILRDKWGNYNSACTTIVWENNDSVQIMHGNASIGEVLLIPKVPIGRCRLIFRNTLSGSAVYVYAKIFVLTNVLSINTRNKKNVTNNDFAYDCLGRRRSPCAFDKRASNYRRASMVTILKISQNNRNNDFTWRMAMQ